MDLDELLNEINNATTTESKSKKKKAKKTEPVPAKVEVKNITTDQIVETFEAVKLGDPLKADENFKNTIEGENVVKVLEEGDEINTESNVEVNDEEKKKKKRKKKKKTGEKKDEGEELENEKEVATNLEENINKYRHLFDFSKMELNNSKFQDNSMFRVIKNWEEKPWNQT